MVTFDASHGVSFVLNAVRGVLVALRRPRGRDVPTGRALRRGCGAHKTQTQIGEVYQACIWALRVVMANPMVGGMHGNDTLIQVSGTREFDLTGRLEFLTRSFHGRMLPGGLGYRHSIRSPHFLCLFVWCFTCAYVRVFVNALSRNHMHA
jgi:hypothetical protein